MLKITQPRTIYGMKGERGMHKISMFARGKRKNKCWLEYFRKTFSLKLNVEALRKATLSQWQEDASQWSMLAWLQLSWICVCRLSQHVLMYKVAWILTFGSLSRSRGTRCYHQHVACIAAVGSTVMGQQVGFGYLIYQWTCWYTIQKIVESKVYLVLAYIAVVTFELLLKQQRFCTLSHFSNALPAVLHMHCTWSIRAFGTKSFGPTLMWNHSGKVIKPFLTFWSCSHHPFIIALISTFYFCLAILQQKHI